MLMTLLASIAGWMIASHMFDIRDRLAKIEKNTKERNRE